MTLESATSGASGEFYYLLVDTSDQVGAIRSVILYRASISDGSILSQITLNEPKGKLYEDDLIIATKFKPVG